MMLYMIVLRMAVLLRTQLYLASTMAQLSRACRYISWRRRFILGRKMSFLSWSFKDMFDIFVRSGQFVSFGVAVLFIALL